MSLIGQARIRVPSASLGHAPAGTTRSRGRRARSSRFAVERCVAARVRQAHRDPMLPGRGSPRPAVSFRRRSQVVVVVAHRLEEQAVGRLARNDRCSQAATLSQRHTRINAQAALRFLGGRAVAGVTMLDQQQANPHLEEAVPSAFVERRKRGPPRRPGIRLPSETLVPNRKVLLTP